MSAGACKQGGQAGSGWRGHLEVTYSANAIRTVISHKKHIGPLVIQKPFYPEGEVCHTYLIHPPGGIVGGDVLEIDISVAEQAHALVTTPAANKFYRSAGKKANMLQHINVGKQATMEWLPQESILFDSSQVNMATLVNLSGDSRFIGWEMICLGRPESGDNYESGSCFQRLELYIDGKPRLLERIVFDSNDDFRSQRWGMDNNEVIASIVVYPADKALLNRVREFIENSNQDKVAMGVSLLDDVLVCRGMAKEAEVLRETLFSIWAVIRPLLTGKAACVPRIWNT